MTIPFTVLLRFLPIVLCFLWSGSVAQAPAGRITLPQLQAYYGQVNDTTYVVNFWATWCGPCRMEMPALEQFYDYSQGKKIRLILVSLDEPKYEKQVNGFLQKNGIRAPVFILQGTKGFSWLPQVDPGWQGSIPATLILNSGRGVRYFHEAPLQPGQPEFLLKKLGLD